MAIRTILQYPDPRLRLKAKRVENFDEHLQHLIDDMIETMFAAGGMGLAATQINVHQQVLVMTMDRGNDTPFAVINPSIVKANAQLAEADEYCLSVPETGVKVSRPTVITVRYQDSAGQVIEREVSELEARCFQHEMDHLDGKVIVDHLSPLKRKLYDRKREKQLRKQKKQSA